MATKDITHAIFAINPTAVFKIDGDYVYENIEWQDGTTPISESDLDTKLVEVQSTEDTAVTQKATDKANGNTKLLGLGLTQAEATAMTGYTPE